MAYPKTSHVVTPKPPPNALTLAEQQRLALPDVDGTPCIIGDDGMPVDCTERLPTLRNSYNRQQRENFAKQHLDKHVQAMLNCPFGKDRADISFVGEASLRHVLLPLSFSGFVTEQDWQNFGVAIPEVHVLQRLIEDHLDVDFNPLRNAFPREALLETELNHDRVRMQTAALLYFEGNVASLIRWMQGPHTGAHRDHATTLQRWKGVLRDDTWEYLFRIMVHGCPAKCIKAESTERNFRSYFHYGNHKTLLEDPAKSMKALVKDFKRGYVLVFDKRSTYYILHCHLNPIGMVDLNHPYKNPRPVVDSTFHPLPDSMAVNDWTTKSTEPPLEFPTAFYELLYWFLNMRATYPRKDILLGDDDASGAFRHAKYHPAVAAMHSSRQNGHHVVNTGQTFGGETSMFNWEPFANARKQVARHLWHHPDIVELARPFLPPLEFAPPPTEAEIDSFCPAEIDSLNPGVLRPDGSRLPPLYTHHVDDEYYGDIDDYMERTISASIMSIYEILGYPLPGVPPAVAFDKLITLYSHLRKINGFMLDTRALTVDILDYKRDQVIEQLVRWTMMVHFTLREAAQIVGMLESLSRYTRWGRAWFFAFQNLMRDIITDRYYVARRIVERSGKRRKYEAMLTGTMRRRVDNLLQKEIADFIWCTRTKMTVSADLRRCVNLILSMLSDKSISWATPIPFIVKRDPHAISAGDASDDGAGGHNHKLRYWFDIIWSAELRRRLRLPKSHPDYLQMNCLEFVAVIIQFAAFIVRMSTLSDEELDEIYPNGHPKLPVLLCLTDNTTSKSWAHRVTTKSVRGQQLIGIYAQLLRLHKFGINTEHIPGVLNLLADFISRPTHFDLTHAQRSEQIFRSIPRCRPTTISYRVQNCYSSSPPRCTQSQQWPSPLCQRPWDDSFPPDPLFHVRLLYEVGRSSYGSDVPSAQEPADVHVRRPPWDWQHSVVSLYQGRHHQGLCP